MTAIHFEVLEMLVNSIYTDEMKFTEKCTVRSAIVAADYLMMYGALEKLGEYATKNITDETVGEIYELCDKLAPKVERVLICRIRKGLMQTKIRGGLLELPFDKFKVLVNEDKINPVDEIAAVTTIRDWVLNNQYYRNKYVIDLLKSVAYLPRSKQVSPIV